MPVTNAARIPKAHDHDLAQKKPAPRAMSRMPTSRDTTPTNANADDDCLTEFVIQAPPPRTELMPSISAMKVTTYTPFGGEAFFTS